MQPECVVWAVLGMRTSRGGEAGSWGLHSAYPEVQAMHMKILVPQLACKTISAGRLKLLFEGRSSTDSRPASPHSSFYAPTCPAVPARRAVSSHTIICLADAVWWCSRTYLDKRPIAQELQAYPRILCLSDGLQHSQPDLKAPFCHHQHPHLADGCKPTKLSAAQAVQPGAVLQKPTARAYKRSRRLVHNFCRPRCDARLCVLTTVHMQ